MNDLNAIVPDPNADLAICREILNAGSKSFSAASLLLPKRIRDPSAAFYAFCRVADDAVDLGEDPLDAVRMLRERIDRMFASAPVDQPVDRALAHFVRRMDLPRAPLDALLDGFLWDAQGREYETFDNLLGYAVRVASTVGVMMTAIMGERRPEVLARACDLGIGMQLTNIARDVGEDARNGRVYLPTAWLRDEGLTPQSLVERPRFSPALGRVTARLLRSADKFYARARPAIALLPRDCRWAVLSASQIYQEIGGELAKQGYDSVSSRARVSGLSKVRLIATSWWHQHRLRTPQEVTAAPTAALALIKASSSWSMSRLLPPASGPDNTTPSLNIAPSGPGEAYEYSV